MLGDWLTMSIWVCLGIVKFSRFHGDNGWSAWSAEGAHSWRGSNSSEAIEAGTSVLSAEGRRDVHMGRRGAEWRGEKAKPLAHPVTYADSLSLQPHWHHAM